MKWSHTAHGWNGSLPFCVISLLAGVRHHYQQSCPSPKGRLDIAREAGCDHHDKLPVSLKNPQKPMAASLLISQAVHRPAHFSECP